MNEEPISTAGLSASSINGRALSAAVSRRALLGTGACFVAAGTGTAVASASAAGDASAGIAGCGMSARDRAMRRLVHNFGALTPAQQDAFVRMVLRVRAGMPIRLASYKMHRELGATAREAQDQADEALASVAAAKQGYA